LPAYQLGEPVATWLRGYLPQMSHWTWLPAPEINAGNSLPRLTTKMELRIVDAK
jgi:hypothetical protein